MPNISDLNQQFAAYYTERLPFWSHWGELARFVLPTRFRWLITPNQYRNPSSWTTSILDSTGTIAARTLAAGMMSGVTSPTRPWFKLKIEGFDVEESNEISIWLAEVERRMMRVFSESNFYNAMAQLYMDLSVFGTGVAIIYEDFDDVIRVYNPCAGEFFLANSDRLAVDTLAREFTQTAIQLEQWFGRENLSDEVKNALSQNKKTAEFIVRHIIEPDERGRWTEYYWEKSGKENKMLSKRTFNEWPCMCPRWNLLGNDVYGTGPATDALGDIKQLQQETKRKAQAVDKMVNPPMIADVQLRNQPASLIPGGLTYVPNLVNGSKPGLAPVYQVQFPVDHISQDIALIQERIRTVFFNDLFLMFSQLQTVRSATEIDARREEKLIMLGPVLERFENEALDPSVRRTFNIMKRAGLLPPMPEAIVNQPLNIQYVSMLAEAQSATQTTAIERTLAIAGNLAGISPGIMDKIDTDEAIDLYSTYLRCDPRMIRSDEMVIKIRQDRAAKESAPMAADMAKTGVDAAKTLSETNVGGGQNALEMMMSGVGLQ